MARSPELSKKLVEAEKAKDWEQKNRLMEGYRVRLLMDRSHAPCSQNLKVFFTFAYMFLSTSSPPAFTGAKGARQSTGACLDAEGTFYTPTCA